MRTSIKLKILHRKVDERKHLFQETSGSSKLHLRFQPEKHEWKKIISVRLYPAILKLDKLARNLWWSWNYDAVAIQKY